MSNSLGTGYSRNPVTGSGSGAAGTPAARAKAQKTSGGHCGSRGSPVRTVARVIVTSLSCMITGAADGGPSPPLEPSKASSIVLGSGRRAAADCWGSCRAQPRASARGPLTVGMGLWGIDSNLGRLGEAKGVLLRKRTGAPPQPGAPPTQVRRAASPRPRAPADTALTSSVSYGSAASASLLTLIT